MKETIYTIPLNEAYEENSECPLCFLEKKLEDEALEYALGAAMMEPDYRVESNEIGYCNRHFERLLAMPNKLGLSLVLETHLQEIRNKLDAITKEVSGLEKPSLFKKSGNRQVIDKAADKIRNINDGCMVCNKVNHTMERYTEVFFHMWKNDGVFRDKVKNSKGMCMHHFEKILSATHKYLSEKDEIEFLNILCKKQQQELSRMQEDIHKFTLKFDYRNKNMELGEAVDAPSRVLQKIGGYVQE